MQDYVSKIRVSSSWGFFFTALYLDACVRTSEKKQRSEAPSPNPVTPAAAPSQHRAARTRLRDYLLLHHRT